jgi:hypothetical protein
VKNVECGERGTRMFDMVEVGGGAGLFIVDFCREPGSLY